MKSPTEGAPSLQSKNSNGLLLFDEEGDEISSSGDLSDAGEDSLGESEPVARKRLRKSVFEDNFDEDSEDHECLLPKVELQKKTPRNNKEKLDIENDVIRSITTSGRLKMQEAFQPGSTPVQAGMRRFLCYNMIGSITTVEKDGSSHIEVDFHDTGAGPRVPSMTDYFGFTMASLNENGSVFANPCKGGKNMSTLMYRPFSSWANNSEWSMRFEAEEVKVVALGTGWVAAITSLNFLRIFTEGGLQKYVLSLNGPVVTASGFKDKLAVVTHAAHCLPSNDQMLEFKLFDISNGTQPLQGHLPLTPCSHLTWLGFSEEGQLSSYDSKGVLRVFTNQFGGSWLPLFSASKEKSQERYWVVGLNASKLFCIVCKSPDSFPQVMPKPVLALLSFSFPLASSDLGADDLENEFIVNILFLSQTQKKVEELAGAGLEITSLEDEAFNMEVALDRCILRLIAACCNGDKLVRATELVRLLSLEKSMKGAIKLVTALKLPNLAERFNSILEERLLSETIGTTACPNPTSNGTATYVVEENNNLPLAVDKKKPEPSISLPTAKLPSPVFSKQEKAEVRAKVGREKMEPSGTVGVGNVKERFDQVQLCRPSNPFVKPSNNHTKQSLFDSIKKMKVENEGKR